MRRSGWRVAGALARGCSAAGECVTGAVALSHRLVVTQAQEHRMPEHAVAGHFGVAHLGNQFRFDEHLVAPRAGWRSAKSGRQDVAGLAAAAAATR